MGTQVLGSQASTGTSAQPMWMWRNQAFLLPFLYGGPLF